MLQMKTEENKYSNKQIYCSNQFNQCQSLKLSLTNVKV